jgi:GYF domain 2
MSNRSWFFASQGKQQGPYPEAQLREFIANGTVTAETLVWSEGMAGWQKAWDVPGLMSTPPGPPSIAQGGGPPVIAGGYGGGALSIDFGILEFTWRSIVVLIGLLFVIPAPWALVWYLKWIVTCVHVPGRPNLTFTGSASTVAAWYFGFIVLAIAVALTGVQWLNNLMSIVQFALYWLLIKWLVANLASGGQPLGLSFSGSFWAYLGWNILVVLAIITIIGWAWVEVAQLRWLCRNIQGTRREVVFTGTGLEFLWRSIIAVLACLFIIPIPWMYRWMMRWLASQTVLAERSTQANA